MSKSRQNSNVPNRLTVADRTALISKVGTREGEMIHQADIGLTYTWKSSGVIDNGGTQIEVGNGSGWVASYSGAVNVKWFGATGDGTTNDTNSLYSAYLVGSANNIPVYIPSGRYFFKGYNYNTNYIDLPNLKLVGEKMPILSANCDRLEHGTVLAGRFNVFADNFSHENIGYDMGDYTISTHYSGYDTLSANHPDGGTWDAFAFAQPNFDTPIPSRRNFYAKNVIGLVKESGTVGHAMLQEGINGGVIESSTGVFGVHGNVIKSTNIVAGTISGYACSDNNIIIKADTYAACDSVYIETAISSKNIPNRTPYFTVPTSLHGLHIDPATANVTDIVINHLSSKGSLQNLSITGSNVADGINIGYADLNNFQIAESTLCCNIESNTTSSKIGKLSVTNCTDGVVFNNPNSIIIDDIIATNVTLRAIQALGNANATIGTITTFGAVEGLYAISDTARLKVGKENLISTPTTKFTLNPPSLTANWSEQGAEAFSVNLANYGVEFNGLLTPDNTSANVVNLPPYLRPASTKRLLTYGKGSGGDSSVLVGADTNIAYLSVNDAIDTTGCDVYLSLSELRYKFDA